MTRDSKNGSKNANGIALFASMEIEQVVCKLAGRKQ
jgi:hypothetical protein